jgi:cytoskeleton protein RodZ
MTAIGETLRRERLRRNLNLETVSKELKIAPRLLDAIENDNFDRLPGGVFAKAFVRQYAHFLGLDEEELAGQVQRILHPGPEVPAFAEINKSAPPIELPRVDSWETVGERRFQWSSPLPALALVVVVMMACAGIYSWWQRNRHVVAARGNTPPPVTAPAATQPVPAAAPPPDQQSAPATPAEQAQATPVNPPAQANPQPVETAPAAAVSAARSAEPPSNPNASVRVELMAEEPVWVSARSDGKYVFSETLEPNKAKTVEANSVVILRVGNAGGVNITLNGKSIGAIGPKGQVRTVQLTSGGFEIVAAPKPPAVPLDPLR